MANDDAMTVVLTICYSLILYVGMVGNVIVIKVIGKSFIQK